MTIEFGNKIFAFIIKCLKEGSNHINNLFDLVVGELNLDESTKSNIFMNVIDWIININALDSIRIPKLNVLGQEQY